MPNWCASDKLHRFCGAEIDETACGILCGSCEQKRLFAVPFSEIRTCPAVPPAETDDHGCTRLHCPYGAKGICFHSRTQTASGCNVIVSENCSNTVLGSVRGVADLLGNTGGSDDVVDASEMFTFNQQGLEGVMLAWNSEQRGLRVLTANEINDLNQAARDDALNDLTEHRHEELLDSQGHMSSAICTVLSEFVRAEPDEASVRASDILREDEVFVSRECPMGGSIILRFTTTDEKALARSEALDRAAGALSSASVRHVAWREGNEWKARSVGRRQSPRRILDKVEQAKCASSISNVIVYLDIDLEIDDPRVKDVEGQVRLLLCPVSDELEKLAPNGILGPQIRFILTLIKEKRIAEAKFWIDGALEARKVLDDKYADLVLRIPNLGPRKLEHLKRSFPTPRRLFSATKQQLAIPGKISVALASRIFASLHGEKPAVYWCGEKRALLWNTKRKMKVAPPFAPLMQEAEGWLRKNLHCEWYAGQEKEEETPSTVPTGITPSAYTEYCNSSSETWWLDGLDQTLKKCELMRVVEEGEGRSVDLFSALARAQSLRDASKTKAELRRWIREVVLEEVGEDGQVYDQLVAAANALHTSIWVYTSIKSEDGERVLLVKPSHANQGSPRPPLRLSQHAGAFRALVAMVGTTPDKSQATTVIPQPDGQVLERKEELEQKLLSVKGLIERTEQETRKAGAEVSLTEYTHQLTELIQALRFRDGQSTVLLGSNSTGKTSIINISHHMTCMDQSEYGDLPKDYEPEALQLLQTDGAISDDVLITLDALSTDDTARAGLKATHRIGIEMVPPLSDPTGAEADRTATQDAVALEESIRSYCAGYCEPPKLNYGVLPAGRVGGTTTMLHTRTRYGRVAHLLIKLYTLEQAKAAAYEFVVLYRNAEGLAEDEKQQLFRVWCFYYALTTGNLCTSMSTSRFERDIPPIEELPQTADEVPVCDTFQQILNEGFELYLGRAESIHLDCAHIRQKLTEINSKDNLKRMVVESIEVFLPSAVFEGGNGFVDLPGLADMDAACEQQTYEGVQQAAAVFVVLPKALAADKLSAELLCRAGVVKRVLEQPGSQGSRDVGFLINPEVSKDHDKMKAFSEDKQANALLAVNDTRQTWRQVLINENSKLRDEGLGKTDEEVEEIVRKTEIRNIYPMLHASFISNMEYAQEHAEQTERVLRLSNMYWLTGVLAARNREMLVRQLQVFVDTTFPQLLEKVLASQKHEAVSEDTNATAVRFLRAAKVGRYERFGIHLEPLVKDTIDLMGACRAKLHQQVQDFFDEGEQVATFLDKAVERQPCILNPLLERMKRRFAAMRAVSPSNKGNLYNYRLKPAVFGGDDNPIDFQPLVDRLLATMKEATERVMELLVGAVEKLLPKKSGDRDHDAINGLKESFFSEQSLLIEKFSTNFFAARQNVANLKVVDRVGTHLRKLAMEACDKAVTSCILSKSDGLSTVSDVKHLILTSVVQVREEWKRMAAAAIFSLVEKQLGTLTVDLTQAGRGRSFLLRQALVGYLKLVVQHYQMHGQPQLQVQLKEFHAQLRRQHEQLGNLCHDLQEMQDPTQLGMEATRTAEKSHQTARYVVDEVRHQGPAPCPNLGEVRQQGLAPYANLGRPDRKMPITDLATVGRVERFIAIKESGHIFARGSDDSLGDLASTFETLQRQLWPRVGSMPDVFTALCVAAWTSVKIRNGRENLKDALPAASAWLRATAVAELKQRFSSYQAHTKAKLADALGQDLEAYLQQLRSKEYPGDLLCLFMLALRFKLNVLVFRPGGDLPILITYSDDIITGHEKLPMHHVAVTAAGDNKGGTNWFCSLRPSMRTRFSDENQTRELSQTDGMTSDDVEARRSVPRSAAHSAVGETGRSSMDEAQGAGPSITMTTPARVAGRKRKAAHTH